jgi:hypothetical protein
MIPRAVALAASLAISSPSLAAEPQVTAFVHVNVVPMDRDRVLSDQTVLVDKGVIAAIGRDVRVPDGARVIEGSGKFLSPGLADMHSHSNTSADLKVYLANGVTTILNLGGETPTFMDQVVPSVNRGERPGPHVYAALRIDGTPQYGQLIVPPDLARAVVRLAKANGYRFMKFYNNLSPAAFAATVDEARKLGLGLAGHHLERVPLETEIAGGDFLVAHLEEMMYGLYTPPASDPLAPPPDSMIPQMVDLLKRHHAFIVADLFTFQTIAAQWGRPDVVANYLARPEAKYVPMSARLDWIKSGYAKRSDSQQRHAAFLARLVKALSDGGVPLVTGTDAPGIAGVVPGFSVHEDLDRLVGAGLSPFDALSAATREPGEYVSRTIHDAPLFGEVQPGYRADLMLSEENPLASLETLRNPDGVMVQGHWYDKEQIKALLDEVSADYSQEAAFGTELAK